jgi:hypothetical protein
MRALIPQLNMAFISGNLVQEFSECQWDYDKIVVMDYNGLIWMHPDGSLVDI